MENVFPLHRLSLADSTGLGVRPSNCLNREEFAVAKKPISIMSTNVEIEYQLEHKRLDRCAGCYNNMSTTRTMTNNNVLIEVYRSA